ncbi:MipA/OmpV family protein [Colwellia sp. Bg11-28]|uniref:MipA/OmpV family protein n=1 Tax=Colwellia sp. Bg11-28 TaxID=2058305 RepID=UPI000C338869|nr:MipA/OmpV family protein [Colwellia sp. Bg11-28]PKH89379.1 MipA/OmpV family protein [Colwellia sp. Bg11-28]
MKYLALCWSLALLSSAVFADGDRGDVRERIEPKGFLYGLGLGINQEIYSGYDYRVIPLPIIGYRGDNFRVLGPFVSYDALEFSDIELTVQIAPRFQGFDESDSFIFENMQERKFSMDAGLGLSYQKKDWKIGLSSMFDVLGRSNGYEAKANISRVFRKGPLFFEPSLSVSYLDSNHVDYYYGVKASETNEFTSQYLGKSALNTTISLSLATPIFLGGFTRIVVDYTWYDSAITNSPLVEDEANMSARFLFSKFF